MWCACSAATRACTTCCSTRPPRQSEESPMRTLGLIAIGGLGIGIASLSLAYALGGRDLHRLPFELASSCGDGAKGGPSVRQLAWGNGDTIELSLPGTVTFRGGQGSDIVVKGSPDLV